MKFFEFPTFFQHLNYIQTLRNIIFSCIYCKAAKINQKYFFIVSFVLISLLICIPIHLQRQISIMSKNLLIKGSTKGYYITFNISNDNLVKIPSLNELKVQWVQKKIERMSNKMKRFLVRNIEDVKEMPTPNYKVHIFYYPWFRTPEQDGYWMHWNKELSDNDYIKDERKEKGQPPEDIYSSFFPKLGCYSSRNQTVIDYHMKIIRKAGIGVVIVSWVPAIFPDSPKDVLQIILDIALKYELKVAFQIDSYKNRTHISTLNQIKYIILKFGDHPSLYLLKKNNEFRPVFYIYESYKINPYLWKEIYSEEGNFSIRRTKYDGTFIGHITESSHGMDSRLASFDGVYTYSSGNGLTYGATWKNWKSLAKFCKENKLIFIPCVGPGFSDVYSMKNTRHRLNGNYFEVGWRSALSVTPVFIAITSFNNWQEGNQIEPAIPKKTALRTYLDYEPQGPTFYINLSRWWIKKFLTS